MTDQSVCDLILNGKFDELKKKINQNRDLINKTDEVRILTMLVDVNNLNYS